MTGSTDWVVLAPTVGGYGHAGRNERRTHANPSTGCAGLGAGRSRGALRGGPRRPSRHGHPGSDAGAPAAPASADFAAAPNEDWLTFHHDTGRSGVAADQVPLGPSQGVDVATADGKVYASRSSAGDTCLSHRRQLRYAWPGTGAVVWRAALESPPGKDLPCGNIDPSGITGTPVVERRGGTVYVVPSCGTAPPRAVRPRRTGGVRWHG